jgi:DNA end-binding protein Ku
MPPRATWKGHLKLSLVNVPVRVYNATTSTSRIALNQLHKDCHQRLRQRMVCPEHGEVTGDDIVKGYEFEKGRYVIVEPEDLERIQLESTKAVEITQFIDPGELKPIYLDAPYYIAPDGRVAEEAFRVIREAMRRTGKIAIGRFVLGGREHLVSLEVDGRGLRMTTLRADNEVRQAEPFFEEIGDGEINPKQLELAEQLIRAAEAPLDTASFRDRYQDALLGVIKAKVEGEAPAVVQEAEAAPSLSFMDALRASITAAAGEDATRKKPPAPSVSQSEAEPATTRKKKKA